jgi:hypothetical protein
MGEEEEKFDSPKGLLTFYNLVRTHLTVPSLVDHRNCGLDPQLIARAGRALQDPDGDQLIPGDKSINSVTNFGCSWLHIAADAGAQGIVQKLIENGALPNIVDFRGETALFAAVRRNFDSVAEMLILHGADVNVSNHEGQTPLHVAARKGSIDCVHLLIQYGAEIDVLTMRGNTPALAAVSQDKLSAKHLESVTALMVAGSNLKLSNKYGMSIMKYVSASEQALKRSIRLGEIQLELGKRSVNGSWVKPKSDQSEEPVKVKFKPHFLRIKTSSSWSAVRLAFDWNPEIHFSLLLNKAKGGESLDPNILCITSKALGKLFINFASFEEQDLDVTPLEMIAILTGMVSRHHPSFVLNLYADNLSRSLDNLFDRVKVCENAVLMKDKDESYLARHQTTLNQGIKQFCHDLLEFKRKCDSMLIASEMRQEALDRIIASLAAIYDDLSKVEDAQKQLNELKCEQKYIEDHVGKEAAAKDFLESAADRIKRFVPEFEELMSTIHRGNDSLSKSSESALYLTLPKKKQGHHHSESKSFDEISYSRRESSRSPSFDRDDKKREVAIEQAVLAFPVPELKEISSNDEADDKLPIDDLDQHGLQDMPSIEIRMGFGFLAIDDVKFEVPVAAAVKPPRSQSASPSIVEFKAEENLCVVCIDRPRSFLIVPCRHLALCASCAQDEWKECPICKQGVSDIFEIFMP